MPIKAKTQAQAKRAAQRMYPRAIERSYAAYCRKQNRIARSRFTRRVRPFLNQYRQAYNAAKRRADSQRRDADPAQDADTQRAYRNLIAAISAAAADGRANPAAADAALIRRVAVSVFEVGRRKQEAYLATYADQSVKKRIEMIKLYDVAPEKEIAEFVRDNVTLIESIPAVALDRVETKVIGALEAGTDPRVFARTIRESFEVSDSRAKLIARDQISKANGDITERTQREAGIGRYRWLSSHDARVRSAHADLDGEIFSWNDPPVTNSAGDKNHPGGDYQCRCVAIPVIEDEEDPDGEIPPFDVEQRDRMRRRLRNRLT